MKERLRGIDQKGAGSLLPIGPEVGKEEKGEWWFQPHPLALVEEMKVMGDGPGWRTLSLVEMARREIYSSCAEAYLSGGCDVLVWDDRRLVHYGEQQRGYQPPAEKSPYAMILNPVTYSLPDEVVKTLAFLRENRPPFHDEEESARPKDILRYYLPETSLLKIIWQGLPKRDLPLIWQVGGRVSRRMNLTEKHHHNFTNVIFIRDEAGDIKNLPHLWLQHFGWSLMAKVGGFKSLIVPYQMVDGHLRYELILNSLEGGHPLLFLRDLPRRLMAFGSAREMKEWEVIREVMISRQTWRNLPEIKGLKALSRFCDDNDLLSPPVVLRDLVRTRRLARMIKWVTKYSRQAEGAFVAFAPVEIEALEGFGSPFTGIYLATRSGRFGAVKTALKDDDFDAVVTFLKGGVPGIALVEGGNEKEGPSIETYELIHSQYELIEELGRDCLLRLRRVDGGYVFDEEGDLRVVPWRLILHFHRNFIILKPEKILRIEVDLEEDPPFPCGSDKTHEVTKKALRKAYERWIARGRQAIGAVIRFKNHGCLFVGFWGEGEDGRISENPAATFVEAIERKYLQPLFKVEQG